MALSLTEQHKRRVRRLAEGVKAYALEAGIPETTASRRILEQSHELVRLLDEGGTLKPETLEKRERKLKEERRRLKSEAQALSA